MELSLENQKYDYIKFGKHAVGGEFSKVREKCFGPSFNKDEYQDNLEVRLYFLLFVRAAGIGIICNYQLIHEDQSFMF